MTIEQRQEPEMLGFTGGRPMQTSMVVSTLTNAAEEE